MEYTSDLVADFAKEIEQGTKITQKRKDNIIISEILIDEKGEKILGKRKGHYITLEFKQQNFDKEAMISIVTEQIKFFLQKQPVKKIMVVGLGNETLIADKFGVLVSRQIEVMQKEDKSVTSVAPSVEGLTGIDSKLILNLLIEQVRPDLLIMVDALMTRNLTRLISLLQISDTPLDFGGSTPQKRKILSDIVKETAVLSIGFPTTISVSNIVKESLAKINPLPRNASLLQNDYDNVVVAPAECDYLINEMADSVSRAINEAIAYTL